MYIDMRGRLHSVESFSAVDGRGVRTVFFLTGCPLRCKYCHNPDTWHATGECVLPEDLLKTALRFKPYFGNLGGVTFSGGEPLAQAEFVRDTAKLLSDNGINYIIETAGFELNDSVQTVLSGAAEVLLDIKHADSAKYLQICGGDINVPLRVLDFLLQNSVPTTVRQVIVPGFNDTRSDVLLLKKIARGVPIELLPYHSLGEQKWAGLGLIYELSGTALPSATKMAELKGYL